METVWYFAYGSNLDPGTFLGRRRMRPFATRRARLAGFALVFDLPVGPGERAVANVRLDSDACIWGVAYEISTGQAAWLDRTEGVHRGSYARIPVLLDAEPGDALAGFTYQSGRGVPGRKPSRRYLNLILRGARHHLLPDDYVRALRALELARDERSGQLELFPPA